MTTQNIQVSLHSSLWRLGIAAAFGVAAMMLLNYYIERTLNERSGGQRVDVVVAKSDLAAGSSLSPDILDVQQIPKIYVHPSAVQADDLQRITGLRVYRAVRQGQTLLMSDLDAPSLDRIAPSSLAKGMRGAAVPLGGTISKSRMLSIGDYIDVLATFNLGERGDLTITLFQHVQIIEQDEAFAIVALTPEQVEQLVFAQGHATIVVSLRNRLDTEQPPLKNITLGELLHGYGDVKLPTTSIGSSVAPAHPAKTGGKH